MKWDYAPGLAEEIRREVCERWASFTPDRSDLLVKANPLRSVYRVPVGPDTVYLKRYHLPRLIHRWKTCFLASQARKEWRALRRFREEGIPAPLPLALGERNGSLGLHEAALLTREVAGGVSIEEALGSFEHLPPPVRAAEREHLLADIAELAGKLHRHRILHRDFHVGNLLYDPGTRIVTILDLHRSSRLPTLPSFLRCRDLAPAVLSLERFYSTEEIARFLEIYARGSRDDVRSLRASLVRATERKVRIHRRSRDRRCLLPSTNYAVERWSGRRLYRRRSFSPDRLEPILGMVGATAPVQAGPRAEVHRVSLAGTSFAVKIYRPSLFRSPGKQAWRMAHAFREREVPTPEAYAYLESVWGGAILITEWLEGAMGLPAAVRFLLTSPRKLHRLATVLGEAFRRLHALDLYHNDTKAPNILVRPDEDPPAAFWIDLDAARVRPTTLRDRLKNLVSIEAYFRKMGPCPPRSFKLRFLRAYAPPNEVRTWWRRMEEGTRDKLRKERGRDSRI